MSSDKKKLAIVSTVLAPYRISQHLRIAREMGDQIQLFSCVLFQHDWQPWTHEFPEEIGPVVFGKGESSRGKNRHPIRQWKKMGRVIEFLKEHQIDMVITTGVTNIGSLRLVRWCHQNSLPVFMFADANVLGDTATGAKRAFKNAYMNYAVSRMTGLLPCGTRGQQYFARYGGEEKPNFFMPHEPDYGRIFDVTKEACAELLERRGWDPERKRIIFTGRLVKVKGIETLIDAFVKIHEQRPEWDLLIVGGGELEQELRDRVAQAIPDPNRVLWTGFINDQHELSTLYRVADVFVLPSVYEPWAAVVPEAAAAGLVILASEMVGAAAELCVDGVNGGTFSPRDSQKLAELLLDVTSDPQRMMEMRNASLGVLDDWRRRGDPVQGVRLAMACAGLLPEPGPVEPSPPTPKGVDDLGLMQNLTN